MLNKEKYGHLSVVVKGLLKEAEDKYPLVSTSDYKEFKEYCDRILDYAKETGEDCLYAIGYYYLTQYMLSDNQVNYAVETALKGIEYQQQLQEYELVARSYNTLGILSCAVGNISKAVEYLLSSIEFSTKYKFDYVHCMSAANLAGAFHQTQNFERAVYYYDEAERYFKRCMGGNDDADFANIINLYCNKGHCHIAMHNIPEANKCAGMVLAYIDGIDKPGNEDFMFTICSFLAEVEHLNKNEKNMDYYIKKACTYLDKVNNYAICIDDLEGFIRLIIGINRYKEADEILEYYIEKSEKENALFNIKGKFLDLRIESAELSGDIDAYMKYSRIFFKYYDAYMQNGSEIPLQAETMFRENISLQNKQYELHLANEKLMLQAKYDALTGLPNRSYMNSFAEDRIKEAYKNSAWFGIEILDIDLFKNINDGYGHLMGDRYLILLSDILKKMANADRDIFAARYGGDEFVIIYYNKTSRQIEEFMAQLKENVKNILFPDESVNGHTYMTISQGCFNREPADINRVWDFFAEADQVLYDVKENGRNSYAITEKIKGE